MPKPPKKAQIIEDIAKIAAKRGVSIILDGDDLSPYTPLTGKYHFNPDTKVLTIAVNKLNQNEEKELIEIIKDYFEKYDLILDAEQEEILANYKSYNDTNPYTDLLSLYEGKIPPKDLYALKMSFFMKVQKENDINVDEYKQQIRARFGSRGAYIANLCNAGFFEREFKNAIHKLDPSKFSQYYELRVGLELAALFVHSGLTINSLKEAFKEKLTLCQQNDITKFRFLGFGGKNVQLMRDFFQECAETDFGVDYSSETLIECNPPYQPVLECNINLS